MAIRKEVFGPQHLESAKTLILSDLEKENVYCTELAKLYREENLEKTLASLVKNGFGTALLDGEQLIGYIALLPPRYQDDVEREFHTPLGGFHFQTEAYSLLPEVLEDLKRQVTVQNGTGISISVFLHEKALESSTLFLDRIDAICSIPTSNALQDTRKVDFLLEELQSQEFPTVQSLKEKLTAFFAAPPISRHTTEEENQVWLQDEKKRVFTLKKENQTKGFFALTKNGRNFLTKDIWSSYGFFLEQENRGEGGGRALLQYTLETLSKEGECFLGTDYNTMNTGAERFWKKSFTPYCGTYKWTFHSQ